MSRELHEYLSRDHDRLDALIARAIRSDGTIDEESYTAFRGGLLRHIGIEERILFPEIRRRRGASVLEEQLHREHAVLAALLVPAPSVERIEQMKSILRLHNPLEEESGGLYDVFEELAADDLGALTGRVRGYGEVRLAPYIYTEITRSSTETLIREMEAGRKRLRK